jgi:DNA polymerase III alpha subunit
MAALMTNEINRSGPDSKLPVYVSSCREQEIAILPPDVNHSHAIFTVDAAGGGIRVGLAAVKGVIVMAEHTDDVLKIALKVSDPEKLLKTEKRRTKSCFQRGARA